MNPISKSFIVASAILFVTAFMPMPQSQAQIFEGTESSEGISFGMCLGDAVKNTSHPDYDSCKEVDCYDPANEDEIAKCTSEAEVGTGLAKDSLEGTGITHTDNFGDLIKKLVNFALPYLTLAAFVGYVVAGFMYVTAFGNDEQLKKAKDIIVWASVGLILVILSYAITNLFTGQLVESLGGGAASELDKFNEVTPIQP